MIPKVRFVTWSSDPDDKRLKLLKESANKTNINIDVIPCFSLMDKISSLLTYLEKVNDEDIICSTDGYDVLYVQSADQVMTSFLGFKTEILISG